MPKRRWREARGSWFPSDHRRSIPEQLSELHRDAHRSLDFQLAGHIGHGRVERAGDELFEILEADGDGGFGLAARIVDDRRRPRAVPEDDAVIAEIELQGVTQRRRRAGAAANGGSGAFERHGLRECAATIAGGYAGENEGCKTAVLTPPSAPRGSGRSRRGARRIAPTRRWRRDGPDGRRSRSRPPPQ